MIEFDHIAIGTSNLNDGVKWAEGKLHSKIPYGGKHDQMGTHNHVLSSGNKTYLEILSKDLSAPPNKRNTWFGMDDPKVELALYKSPKNNWLGLPNQKYKPHFGFIREFGH